MVPRERRARVWHLLGRLPGRRSQSQCRDPGGDIDWKNIQARLFTDAPYFYSYVTNAGSAKIDGIEFSATVHANRYVSYTTNGTYQNARLSTFLPDTFAVDRGFAPSMVRLQDSGETELAFNMKAPAGGVAGWIRVNPRAGSSNTTTDTNASSPTPSSGWAGLSATIMRWECPTQVRRIRRPMRSATE